MSAPDDRPRREDCTAAQVCELYGWTREQLQERIRTGIFPPHDYAWADEPHWREASVLGFTNKLAVEEIDQTLEHLSGFAPHIAAELMRQTDG